MAKRLPGLVLLVVVAFPARAQEGQHEGPTTSDPVVNQNVTTARMAAFRTTTLPALATAAEEDDEAGRTGAMFQEMSSDIEYESFSIGSLDGTNFAVQAGYARSNATGSWLYGGNAVFNSRKFDFAGAESNLFTTVQLFGNRTVSSSLAREAYVGTTVTGQFNDIDGADTAFSIGLHAVQNHFMNNGGSFTYGGMLQANMAGDLTTFLGNLAVMYGVPIGRSLALNVDALLVYTVAQSFDGTKIDLGNRFMLNPGAYLTWFATPSFGLNLGVKTALLLEDYSSIEAVLGARFRF